MATLLPLGVALFMTKPLWLVKELNIQAPSANSTIGRRLMERDMVQQSQNWRSADQTEELSRNASTINELGCWDVGRTYCSSLCAKPVEETEHGC